MLVAGSAKVEIRGAPDPVPSFIALGLEHFPPRGSSAGHLDGGVDPPALGESIAYTHIRSRARHGARQYNQERTKRSRKRFANRWPLR